MLKKYASSQKLEVIFFYYSEYFCYQKNHKSYKLQMGPNGKYVEIRTQLRLYFSATDDLDI